MEPRELRLALCRLENERRRFLRREFQQLNIPLGQGQPRLLDLLLRGGPQGQRELGETSGIDSSTLSRSLDRLAAAGLVTRTQDPACRRCQKIALTDSGRAAAEQVASLLAREDAFLCAQLTGEEQAQLIALLDRLFTALKNAGEPE